MAIFLDTGKIKEVERFMKMGIIRGVTTNPTILCKDGVTGGVAGIRQRSIEIAKLIAPYPLSVEGTTVDPAKMIDEAREFAQSKGGTAPDCFHPTLKGGTAPDCFHPTLPSPVAGRDTGRGVIYD